MSCAIKMGYSACILLRNIIKGSSKVNSQISNFSKCVCSQICPSRLIHSSQSLNASHFKARDRKDLLRTVTKPDEGLEKEHYVSLNARIMT